MQQKVFLQKDDGSKPAIIAMVPITEFSTMIPQLCVHHNTYDVKLSGTLSYLEGIAKDIKQEADIKFADSKIKIEVIK